MMNENVTKIIRRRQKKAQYEENHQGEETHRLHYPAAGHGRLTSPDERRQTYQASLITPD